MDTVRSDLTGIGDIQPRSLVNIPTSLSPWPLRKHGYSRDIAFIWHGTSMIIEYNSHDPAPWVVMIFQV